MHKGNSDSDKGISDLVYLKDEDRVVCGIPPSAFPLVLAPLWLWPDDNLPSKRVGDRMGAQSLYRSMNGIIHRRSICSCRQPRWCRARCWNRERAFWRHGEP